MAEWLFLAVPWDCLWFVIVVFPDHTHLLLLHMLKIQSDYNHKDMHGVCHMCDRNRYEIVFFHMTRINV